ncbi:hypothetical protein BST97_07655 [Nonlabens spongiae]|uniref:DUF4890 domain-containing protein n=1 Tax=Nonlabens spongiae TaxID=331648 RepID=A0A1W6MJY9_9FLAO|nr:hypothetical protein [Nonlabens spongiae]ARN77887.1 hypothetical protein BST97_07655 [Nonlabens spongiae]
MKKLAIIGLFLLPLGIIAQPGEKMRKIPSPEVQAKQMTLALDLTDKQEKQIIAVLENQSKAREENKLTREERRELSQEKKEELRVAMLDQRIAMKREMKSILNDEQYKRWEKMMVRKGKNKMKRMKKMRDRRDR